MKTRTKKQTAGKNEGWVALPRAVMRRVFPLGPPAVALCAWLYARARHLPTTVTLKSGKSLKLHVGQVIVGYKRLQRELSAPHYPLTRQTYRSTINKLTAAGICTTKVTTNVTIATLVHYIDLAGIAAKSRKTSNHTSTTDPTTTDERSNHEGTTDPTSNVTTKNNVSKEECPKEETYPRGTM